ncbi:Uncharacterized protein TPAR_01619 [Tolypocladium paradoxum]|uniref:Fumarylacetoacetase-like C-terminal domain-containing protein n=1 Tax=Tolypocladium paradoxum TaxID=94208 RepID=A0A2S4L6X5_9HYPO|nr:Uncharacterized protein TPAR_01619 [Tolypocladium paradoxum]
MGKHMTQSQDIEPSPEHDMIQENWTHLVRFLSKEDGRIHLGQVDAKWSDVGLALEEGSNVTANLVEGTVFDGVVTDRVMTISQVRENEKKIEKSTWRSRNAAPAEFIMLQLLSPLAPDEVPVIRCLGLNYRDHAREASMPIPDVPVLFIKPRTALNGPAPARITVPKIAQDGSSDYEAELSIVISKTGRDIPKEKAMDYVLGYTCSNDISARTQQFKNSQWCFSKASTIAFLSQGTTLERGTIIMTGTGPGIGAMRNPQLVLRDGDDMRVEIEQIGTLINKVLYE